MGFIECPATYDFVYNNTTRQIALYELMENIPAHEYDFDGKAGDIILGGGSGETPAFRISIPEALLFFNKDDWNDFKNYEDLFKVFWTPTQSYIFCEGFSKIGWTPDSLIEFWLAENLSLLLPDKIEKYSIYKTNSGSVSKLEFINVEI